MMNRQRRTFLGSAAALTALALPRFAEGAQQSADEKANVELVNRLIASASSRNMDTMLQFLAADCVYRITETAPPATGHDEIRARLGPSLERVDNVEWEILETFSKGPMVVNHRIDRFLGGARPFTWEGVGVFFVKDGKIKEWSDFTIKLTR